MSDDPELITLLKKLRYDLTGMQVKVSEALRMVAALDLAPAVEHRCPHCSLVLREKLALAEHVYVSHEGPEPEHWKEAERLAEEDGVREDA